MIAFFYILLATYLIQKRWQHFRKRIKKTKSNLDFTVIIPFRNEEKNLPQIIKCLQNQNASFNLIWVNDHSDDNSLELIQKAGLNGVVIHLDKDEYGKKMAIHQAVKRVNTPYFLTLDADVTFNTNYFQKIQQLPLADLIILPVVMKGKSWIGKFGAFEFMKLQTINFIADQIWRPIMSSGANLLVQKAAYETVNKLENHQQFLSGDDQFLLKGMRDHKKSISVIDSNKFSVYTTAPNDLRSLTDQRLRWAGKSKAVNDWFANFIGLFLITFQIIYFGYILYFLFAAQYEWASLTIGAKLICDLLLYSIELSRFKSLQKVLLLPLFEFLYPFYLIYILSRLSSSIEWKGRNV
jgi:glycosyltransferase involved in cell wall biosynthesis